MQKGILSYWRRLGRVEQSFLICIALFLILYFSGLALVMQALLAVTGVLLGLVSLFRLARRGMKQAIWRLRNRLIAAYLFIAVVPVVLILTLLGIAGYVVIGQMAIYLVSRELEHHEQALLRPAERLAHVPITDPSTALSSFKMMTRDLFPDYDLLLTGKLQLRYPATTQLVHPPAAWSQSTGLIIKNDGKQDRLYAWAHVLGAGNEVTVVAPVTHEVLAKLIPGLGDVKFIPIMGHASVSHIPPPLNAADLRLNMFYPVMVQEWESPKKERRLTLLVNTRLSAVLGIVFGQKMEWGEVALSLFEAVGILFLLVELASLVAGVQLSRTITGAVHELYEGTQHVKEGDFLYRVPVKGNDQLAELTTSFNNMTSNLGRLIVVAKEKERLESELEIAREVQSQLFPKDVPFTKTLELKGVCNPARTVSGDYYDFMSLSETRLAFAIGDVAGKGISAALLMASIQSTMRSQLNASNFNGLNGNLDKHLSAARVVSILNKQLFATTAPEKYATFYFAMYDETTHSLTYTNAGHLSPILLRGATLIEMPSTGTVVGAFASAVYGEETVSLEHGDLLVAYTDGMVEPENAYGEMFGEDRLKDLLLKYERADSSEIIARSMEAVTQWAGEAEQSDDMTMVVARRL
jgi:sigma-B regulation protein RsbU (phosphoserine phosphatase)